MVNRYIFLSATYDFTYAHCIVQYIVDPSVRLLVLYAARSRIRMDSCKYNESTVEKYPV